LRASGSQQRRLRRALCCSESKPLYRHAVACDVGSEGPAVLSGEGISHTGDEEKGAERRRGILALNRQQPSRRNNRVRHHSWRHQPMALRNPALGAQSWNCYLDDTSSRTELLSETVLLACFWASVRSSLTRSLRLACACFSFACRCVLFVSSASPARQ
jgi:hypothetical protein